VLQDFSLSNILFPFPTSLYLSQTDPLMQSCCLTHLLCMAPLLSLCICTYTYTYLYMWCIWPCSIYVYTYLWGLASTYRKTGDLWPSEFGILILRWCSPVPFIYLQTTWFHSSLQLNNTPLCIYTTFSLSIHLFIVIRHLGYFQSLALVNSAAINMCVQVSLSYPGLHSFRYMSRSGIAEL
jgi:hypothetical protein